MADQAHRTGGVVRVLLGPDGLPTSALIAADWRRHLSAAALGDAVVTAFLVAAGARMADQLATADPASRPRAAQTPSPDPTIRVPHAGAPRSLELLAEDVLSVLSRAGELAATADMAAVPAQGSGSAVGPVVVTLSRMGLQSCTIDPTWAAEQHASTLTDAVCDAFRAARADLDRMVGAPAPNAMLDRLFDEARAILAGQRPAGES